MNFTNENNLIENEECTIFYSGDLYQKKSDRVFIVYGFGNNWENLVDGEMTKTELGFQIEVELLDKETFNFCLKNEKDEWDNNDNQNYVFLIEHPETSLILLEEFDVPTIRRLRKSYIISKKIKLAIYKMLIYVPRLISGNYRKKHKQEDNI